MKTRVKNRIKKAIIVAGALLSLNILCQCCSARHNVRWCGQPLVTPPPAVTVQDSQTLVFACFSGGGSRAIALGYYVCEELDKIGMLREIDYASGVSGGSFVAAGLPLYSHNWKEFYDAAVNVDIQKKLVYRMLLPWNWPFLASGKYSRTDLAAEFYDQQVFQRKRFGDIPEYPKIYVNATLLAQGTHWVFTDEYFRYIDSDISAYPLGYACAASSAFPMGFAPLTLENYGEALSKDSLRKDPRYRGAERNAEKDVARYTYKRLRDFLNNKKNKWLHLQDGGLAGNTGARRVLDEWKTNGAINKALNDSDHPLRRLIIIIVNAGTDKPDNSCTERRPPNSLEVLYYTTTTAMDVLSAERTAELQEKIEELWKIAKQSRQGFGFEDPARSLLEKPYLIEIHARNIRDTALASEFNKIPTAFRLTNEQQNVIKKTVNHLLNNSRDFKRLQESLAHKPESNQ